MSRKSGPPMARAMFELMEEVGTALRALFAREDEASIKTQSPSATEEDRLKAKLVRDTGNYVLSKVVPGLMGLLAVPVFVRLVGLEQYGHYAVVYSVVIAWSGGMAGWLSQGVLRFQSGATEPHARQAFNRAVGRGTALSALLGGLGLAVALSFMGLGTGWPLAASILLYASTLVYPVYLARFQASLRSGVVKRTEIVRSVAAFLVPAALVVLFQTKSYLLLVAGVGLGYSLPLAIYLNANRDRMGILKQSELGLHSGKILRDLWSFGWPVGMWLLCQQSLVVSDRYFIQRFSGFSSAGIYASVYDVVVRSFSLLFMPVTLAIHPLVMDRWNGGGRRQALSAIRTGLKYQLLLFVPVVLLLTLLAPTMCRFVLGERNQQAIALVTPLAIVGFLWQISLLVHKPLELLCRTKRMLLGIVGALSVNIAGNYFLIPAFGFTAAAYVGIAASAVYLCFVLGLTPRAEFQRQMSIASPLPLASQKNDDIARSQEA